MTIKLVGAQGDRHRLFQGIFRSEDLKDLVEGTVVSLEWLGVLHSYRLSDIDDDGVLAIAWLD